jgi:hypothetical protein
MSWINRGKRKNHIARQFEQVAARHGIYWRLFTPGAKLAICGLARPIWPDTDIRKRKQCPRCLTELASLHDALSRAWSLGIACQARTDAYRATG